MNPMLQNRSRNKLDRLPGLKWVAEISGSNYTFLATVPGQCPMSLENAHGKFHISPKEFDEVARELKNSLQIFNVPERETNEVNTGMSRPKITCPAHTFF